METISSEQKGVICESEQDELGVTQEQSIDTLEEDIEKFLVRYEKLKEDNDDTLTGSTERFNESAAGQMPTTLEQSSYSLDKFTSYPDVKLKYLEKEANLLEVYTWIRQVGHYIRAGYKHSPLKEVYTGISALCCIKFLFLLWIAKILKKEVLKK